MRQTAFFWVLFLVLAGCQAAPVAPGPLDAERPAEGDEPLPAAKPASEVWAFLLDKYDIDRNGSVSREEYGRGQEAFARLDRNRDGSISGADFGRGRGGARMSPARLAQRAMLRYFHADDDRMALSLAEVGETFADLDTDRDGVLSLEEFEQARRSVDGKEAPRGIPPARRLHGALVGAADRDASGGVTLHELTLFFRSRDTNNDGVWTLGGGRGGGRRQSGVAAGEPAPDFTLTPPNGGEAVTLSSFQGRQPVALIFGSYT